MKRTLEEHVMAAMDVLFRGALFLTAGRERDAERLLEDTVLVAYHQAERSATPPDEAALLVLMARTFLSQSEGAPTTPEARPVSRPPGRPHPGAPFTADDVCTAAAAVAPRARAALWLVLIQRWSYAGAAEALRIDDPELRRRLAQRDRFFAALSGASSSQIAGLGG